jgi:hypothetical protein
MNQFTAVVRKAGLVLLLLAAGEAHSADFPSVRPIQLPVTFTQNCGQWEQDVLYRADAGGAALWFTPNGVVYQLTGPEISATPDLAELPGREINRRVAPSGSRHGSVVVQFLGASPDCHVSADGLLEYKCNYFHGNDPAKWITGAPNYSALTYNRIYPGIDLCYFASGTQVEYAFVLRPGADLNAIRLRYQGATSLSVDESGTLRIETPYGTIRETPPIMYQQDGALQQPVTGSFVLLDDLTFGFKTTSPVRSDLALVIDPKLDFSTLVEGATCLDADLDSSGNIFMTGSTLGGLFTAAPYDASSDYYDAFVTKMSAAGDELLFSTYYGGSQYESGNSIAVNADGSPVITGECWSPDLPAVNAIDNTLDGHVDAFVAKLTPDGSGIEFSTFLGGSDSTCGAHCAVWYYGDFGHGIALDPQGNIYTAGHTQSGDFPLKNAYQTDPAGYYLTKISPEGDSLIYSTYFGGTNTPAWTLGKASFVNTQLVAVDADGSAVLTGFADSDQGFPFVNAIYPSFDCVSGCIAPFVAKWTPDGTDLVFSTILYDESLCGGGVITSIPHDVAVDHQGNILICGEGGCTLPLVNPWDMTGVDDGFVLKLSGDGQTIIYSTFVGGDEDDVLWRIAVDTADNAYVTGGTSGPGPFTYPVVNSDTFGSCDGVAWMVPVAEFTPSGAVVFSQFVPGGRGFGIAYDENRGLDVAGVTSECQWPLRNAFDGRRDSSATAPGILLRLVDGNIDCDCPYDGDVRSDCQIDVLDMSDLIDYIFAGGDQPPNDGPLCPHIDRGDYNCDGQDDALDLAYLIDHIFAGGPCPCNPCACISYPDDCPGL